MQRKVGEQPFERLQIQLEGIPGPGPGRWIAAAFALLAVLVGFGLARRAPTEVGEEVLADQSARKAGLLAHARSLRERRASDEIGPEYYSEQRARIEADLAELLFVEARLAKS